MRIGQNPAKYVREVVKPARITVAVLNYIPFLSGYYAEMLDVLKTCLDSIRQSADLPFDLMVFDNGSCKEVCDYLNLEKENGKIQFLILSDKNLGKGGAWNIIFGSAPGEIIAYADNDCFFYKGWLSKSVQILETFPNVGMVTARPYRTPKEFLSNTIKWAEETPSVRMEIGKLVPFPVLHEFNLSLGQSEEASNHFIETTEDIKLTLNGVSAFAGGSHWQFTTRKDTISKFLPFNMERPMGQVRQLDERMNDACLLRLMCTTPLVMNMSNSLKNNRDTKEIRINRPGKITAGIFQFSPIKKILLLLYDFIFKVYYRG